MEPTAQAAQRILATIEATFVPSHDYVRVEPQQFRHLDLRFYERTMRLLNAKGFRLVADVEDRTITRAPRGVLMPVMLRTMVSRDGTIMAALYHPRLKSLWMRVLLLVLRKAPGRVIDLETECSDGTFVVTSNASQAAAFSMPGMIDARFLDQQASVHEVHQAHVSRVAAHLASRPGIVARHIGTHEQLVASQNRMNALKAAWRGEIGGITREELSQLATLGGASLVPDVHAAIVAEQARRAG